MPNDTYLVTRNRVDELFARARARTNPGAGGLAGLADTPPVVPAEAVDRFWGKTKIGWHRLGVRGDRPEIKPWMQFPSHCLREFGIGSLEFSSGSSDSDRETLLVGIGYSLDRIAKALRIPRQQVGMGRRLAIVARPVPTGAPRYKTPGSTVQLRVTLPPEELRAGDVWSKTFARQYAVALDATLAMITGCAWGACYLTPDSTTHKVNIAAVDGDLQKLAERVFDALYYTGGKETDWGLALKDKGSSANRRRDVLARLIEKYIVEESEGPLMLFFANKVGKGIASPVAKLLYPSGALWDAVKPRVAAFLRAAFQTLARNSADGMPAGEDEKKKDGKVSKSGRMAQQSDSAGNGANGKFRQVVLGEETEIETRTSSIPSRYAIVELRDLLPSNDPLSFQPSEEYPAACQQRDYANDRAEQAKVIEQATKFKPRFLLSDDPTAGNGPPICDGLTDAEEGRKTAWIVMGGNSRTMTMQRAFLLNPQTKEDYQAALRKKLAHFGIAPQEIGRFSDPILVRLIDTDTANENACATVSRLLNANLTQELDKSTETRSLAKELTEDDLERIAVAFEESGETSFTAALANRQLAKIIADTFDRRGIITRHNRASWMTPDGAFTKGGRDNIEGTLLGIILPESALVESARSYTDKLLRALPLLVRLERVSPEWNILPDIHAAIRQESARRASGLNKRDYLSSIPMFQGGPSKRVQQVWELLDAPATQFRQAMAAYVRKAEAESGSSATASFGFEEAPQTPDEILTATIRRAGLGDYVPNPAPQPLPRQAAPRRRVTFADLPEMTVQSMPLPDRWKKFLHKIPVEHSIVIWGPEGSGKSTLAMEWADVLATHNDNVTVLYATSEEGISSGPMQKRAELARTYSQDVHIEEISSIAELDELLSQGEYQFVVVDSLTGMQTDDWEALALMERYPHVSFTFVKHATSDAKRPLGGRLQYMVGAVIKVADGLASTKPRKNRYGPGEVMNVFKRR